MKELRATAASLSKDRFTKEMGPFVLVQRPPSGVSDDTDKMGLPMNVQATAMAKPEDISRGSPGLLFQFEDLLVATLPPLHGVDELTVGRQPDCDLVLDHPSVSKRHAKLRW